MAATGNACGGSTYLLVDEILILALDAQPDFDLFQARSLFKDTSIHMQQLPFCHFPLIRHEDNLASILELAPQTLEGLGDLVVASPRFTSLASLASPEAHVRICVVALLMRLELEGGVQGLVAHLLPPRLPVLVHGLGMLKNGRGAEVVERRDHHVICDDRVVDGGEGGLLSGSVLEHVHDAFKVILGEGAGGGRFGIVSFEKLIVFHCHVIQATDALLHGLREADIGGRLVEMTRVEAIVVDVTLLWGRNRDFLVITRPRILEDGLKMVFLRQARSARNVGGSEGPISDSDAGVVLRGITWSDT